MKVLHYNSELTSVINTLKTSRKTIGLVPTMGALHAGHLSLVNHALAQNDVVIVSIFVNPTQFNNPEDLLKYPRTLDDDIRLLKTIHKSVYVYAPSVSEVYQNTVKARRFNFNGLEHQMEGAFRKGHFDGVGTIVTFLFEISQANHAYFGEKDFQQLQIIKTLVRKYGITTRVVGCPIVRESDGLAMSSRNKRLLPKHRKAAPYIYSTLRAAKQKFGTKSANEVTRWVTEQFKKNTLLELEYFTIANENTLKPIQRKHKNKTYRAFIAVYAGDVRLIDNIPLN